MPTLEERVAYLEGRVEEPFRAREDIKDYLVHIEQKVYRFRDELSRRISTLEEKLSITI